MAKKIGLSVLKETLNSNDHYQNDIILRLATMAIEDSTTDLFIVMAEKSTFNFLAEKLHKQLPNVSVRTINKTLKSMAEEGLIEYSEEKEGWIICNMDKDFKEGGKGYIYIRDIFLTERFSKLKLAEKRFILYICQLLDSKANIYYKGIQINLLRARKSEKNTWLKEMHIDYLPYAIYIISRLLKNNPDWFTDVTIGITTFNFNTPGLEYVKNNNTNDDKELILTQSLHPDEATLLENAINEKNANYDNNLKVTSKEQMHIIRAICNTSLDVQLATIDNILNKLVSDRIHSGIETIKSFSKYVAGITQRLIKEKKEFKLHLKKLRNSSEFNLVT